jgi:deazaflavin-dependent oxidoreductase (nitroreductase family)
MTTSTEIRTPGTPKPWMNSMVRGLLRTPLLNRLLGRAFAVITVTGARTGRRYSTPVQYIGVDGDYIVLSQVTRQWWRNLRTQPEVELLVAGSQLTGRATIAENERAHDLMAKCLERSPRMGKFYGLRSDGSGAFAPADIDRLLEKLVVLAITPDS